MVLLELLIAIYVSVQRYGLQFRVTDWIREDFYRNITDENREQHVELWDELQTTVSTIRCFFVIKLSFLEERFLNKTLREQRGVIYRRLYYTRQIPLKAMIYSRQLRLSGHQYITSYTSHNIFIKFYF